MGRRWLTVRGTGLLRAPLTILIGVSLSGCVQASTMTSTEPPCNDSPELASQVPAALVARGHSTAVGSGDTWFLPPAQGKLSQDVRWDGTSYFLKVGVWTLASTAPLITVQQVGGKGGQGSASSSPTGEGLPGPLPTTLRFPAPGCWEVTAQGTDGRAQIRISFDASARDRR